MKSLHQVLTEYKFQGKAIPAFNIDCFEIYQAVESVIRDTNLPCIVQLSAGEDKFVQAERLFILVKKAQIDGLPIYLNMDHGQDQLRLENLIKLGFDMVHFDGSSLEYQDNLDTAKKFIEKIKFFYPNVLFETEFNKINLVDKDKVDPSSFTKPDQALEFVSETKTDLFAVSIGNLHGVSTTAPESIDLNLLAQIRDRLPEDKFITLHGGSGIPDDQISEAIKLGVVKININTELRLAYNKKIKEIYSADPSEKVYQNLAPAIDEVKIVVKNKLILFSSTKYV